MRRADGQYSVVEPAAYVRPFLASIDVLDWRAAPRRRPPVQGSVSAHSIPRVGSVVSSSSIYIFFVDVSATLSGAGRLLSVNAKLLRAALLLGWFSWALLRIRAVGQ